VTKDTLRLLRRGRSHGLIAILDKKDFTGLHVAFLTIVSNKTDFLTRLAKEGNFPLKGDMGSLIDKFLKQWIVYPLEPMLASMGLLPTPFPMVGNQDRNLN
jgi:hypothetical protein